MKKADYNRFYKILPKQNWLLEKEEELKELLQSCKKEEHKKLLFELLEEFNFINETLLKTYLNLIADYIINDSGFKIERTQIVGMAMDSTPDSSQWILQQLKPVLTKKGWNNVKIITNFTRGVRSLNKEGKNQMILVDEFIGTGQSVQGRIDYLKREKRVDCEIKGCFIAGMEDGINKIINEFSDFKCFLPLKKGISDKHSGENLVNELKKMSELESELMQKINDKELSKYHLGYNQTESLYSSFGNTPNSVFPIFWWPYDRLETQRNTLLIRNEEGLGL